MRTHLKYVLASAGISALVATLAVGRSSPPPPTTTSSATSGGDETTAQDFSETWRAASVPLALKTAKLPLPSETSEALTKSVRTIPIVPPPPPPPTVIPPVVKTAAAAVTEAEEAEVPTRRHHRITRHKSRSGNVCTRHNMRKVKTGKYGWRCRR